MADVPILEPRTAYGLWAESYPPYAHNPLMQAEERAMLSLLPDDLRGKRVLDAGCGSGRYLRHALRRGAPAAQASIFRSRCSAGRDSRNRKRRGFRRRKSG